MAADAHARTGVRIARGGRWRGLTMGALAVALLTAAGCSPGGSPSEVTIVLTAPMSGSDAPAGAAFARGCERAVAERNAAGGVRVLGSGKGLPVRLDLRDDRSETPVAEQALEQVANGGAALAIATPNGVRAIAQAVVAERLELPLVVNPETTPGVPVPHMRWVFALPRDAVPPPEAAPGTAAAQPAQAEIEARGHATLASVLAALDGAGAIDRVTVRAALQSAR